MGRGDEPARGLRSPRVIAHFAIVVVFVLSALGYAPFGERAAEIGTVVAGANRAVTAADRDCTASSAIGRAAGAEVNDATTADADKKLRDCARAKARLAQRIAAPSDPRHSLDAQQAR